MTRSYDGADLSPISPDDDSFARAWVRFWTRDLPQVQNGLPGTNQVEAWPQFSLTDEELDAALQLDAVESPDGAVYYRPHFTAARLYLGNPQLWRTRSVDGTSETRRDPNEIVGAWLAQGRAFDAVIPEGTVLPPFSLPDVTPGTTVPEPDEDFYEPGIPIARWGL
ncbi:hypothetical protein [Deinococcus pimensis]|uniref:hypothetical protein n=1 Tax=Deinococcus pimensis TaxID=309888 RepID=UPI000480BF56|nr:hypothetical protein [Deinococcus pimensis]